MRCAAALHFPADYRTAREYAEVARNCTDVIDDVIASVPFLLGWHLKHPEVLRKADIDPESSATGYENGMYSTLAGYFLIFHLGWIRIQDYCNNSQRKWVEGRLFYIEKVLGIRYAQVVATVW